MKRIEREILALIALRQAFAFSPLTTEGLAEFLGVKAEEIKHVVWGLWMDDQIRSVRGSRWQKRKWVVTERLRNDR